MFTDQVGAYCMQVASIVSDCDVVTSYILLCMHVLHDHAVYYLVLHGKVLP